MNKAATRQAAQRRQPWIECAGLAGLAVLAALLLAVPPAGFAQAPKPPEKVASIEGITEYRLDNGARVLLFPDPSTANVTVNMTVLVGSRHEGYGETGMAHLLEHLVFKGTPTFPDVPKALKDHGAQFNGTTWVDRTNYFETMPGTDENLEFGIKLESDRLVNSFIRRDDLLSEMTVVRNEFEMGENNPSRVLSQRILAVAYEWHNYGKSTIGNRSDIERVPIDNLQAFYKKFYQSDNVVLIISGKFDEAKALAYAQKYLGALPKPSRRLDKTYTQEPAQDGERTVVLRRVGKVGVVGVVYHVPAAAHEDCAAVQMLNSILVSEPSGRLYQALVPTKKANSVSGSAYAWHDPGVIEIEAEVDAGKSLDEVRDLMIGLLEKLPSEKFTEEEVKRAKSRFKRDRDQLMSRSNSIGVQLSEWVAAGDWRLFFLHRDRVAKVTPADIQRVAGKYLQPTNRTVGLFIPTDKATRTAVPESPVLADLLKDYKGTQTVAVGEAFDPSPENIEKRVQRVASTVKGADWQMAVLPKKTRGESVSLIIALEYGNEKSLAGQNSAAQLLGPLMTRGTEKYTRQKLQDELAKLGAAVGAQSGTGFVNFTIQAKRDNLAPVLDLVWEVLRKPTFPAEEFDVLKRENLDRLKKGMVEPTALAFRSLQRQLTPAPQDDVRYVATYEEEAKRLEATTLDQVKQLYQKQLAGGRAVVAAVGDFEVKIDGKQLGTATGKENPLRVLAGTLDAVDPKAAPYQRIARPYRTDIAGGKEVILTPDKANAFYITGHNLALTDADPDYPALVIGNYIFGGGTLSSRIGNRVRQKEGLSYGAVSVFSADSKDKAGRFLMYAICNPDNIDKVEKACLEELDLVLKSGITSEELAAAQKAYLENRKVQRSNDMSLASLLGDGLENSRTFAYHADLEKKIAALTAEQVNAALKKHLDPKRLISIRAGDFNKK